MSQSNKNVDKSPKHGTTNPETPQSQSQADGTAAGDQRGATGAQSSGPHRGNPATAGKNTTSVSSQTPENREGKLDPSAPTKGTEDAHTSPHPSTEGRPLNDTFGEAGDPAGRGTLQVPEQTVDSNAASSNYVGNPPTAKKPGKEGAGNIRDNKDEEAA
jgi:hypothetical protein